MKYPAAASGGGLSFRLQISLWGCGLVCILHNVRDLLRAISGFLVGLLERPVELQTGKRTRRKVDRLSQTFSAAPEAPADKKLVVVPDGSGDKLGDCPASKSTSISLIITLKSLLHLTTFGATSL